jgi:iron(III) transport system substrate-binding protein
VNTLHFRNTWWSAAAGLMAALAMAACGGASASAPASQAAAPAASLSPAQQALYDAAKKEGNVIWQAGVLDQAAEPIGKAFEARYPGVTVTFNPINEPQAPAQIITEATAGSKVVKSLDLGRGSPTQFKPLLDRDMLETVDWASLGVDPSRVQVDGKWVVNEDSVNIWIYNTTLVSQAEAPQTWDDLLKPRWKGKKIVTNASGAGLAQTFFGIGEDKARQFLEGLKGQDVVVVKTKGPAREMVTSGQAQIGISTVKDLLDMKKQGAPVEGLGLGPMERDLRGWYLPKGVQHPNAAKLFISWIVSPEGWKMQQDAGLDIATPCGASDVAKWVCDHNITFTDPQTAGLSLFDYYAKLDSYTAETQKILGLNPAADSGSDSGSGSKSKSKSK